MIGFLFKEIQCGLIKIRSIFFSSVRRKLITVFLFIIILPIAVSSLSSYSFLKSVVQEKVDSASKMVIAQTVRSVERIMRDMLTASNILIEDEEIVNVLKNDQAESMGTYSIYDLVVISKINKLQQSMMDVYLSNLVVIRDNNDYIYTNVLGSNEEKSRVFGSIINEVSRDGGNPIARGSNIKWGEEAMKINISDIHDDRFDENYILMVRPYIGVDSRRSRGDILIGVPEYEFSKILQGLVTNYGVNGYLINDSGYILSSTDATKIGKRLIQTKEPGIIEDESESSIILDEDEYILNRNQLERVNWKIVQAIPKTVLYSEINTISTFILIAGAAFIVIFLFASYIFSRGITNPIYKLNDAAKNIAAGNFEFSTVARGTDEIAQLSESFIIMAQEIKALIEKKEEDEKIKRELELQVLYAQINPHFLFNTLNSIRWMAEASGASNISGVIVALASLLKSSIINKNEYVTISEELDNVENYINIQKVRYSSQFSIEYDISPDILNYYTLKLILQPIVENSIIHGFKDKAFGGRIKITGYKHDDMIIIQVGDNGIGMHGEAVKSLLTGKSPEKSGFSGIGVPNVNDRLILHFGEKYALKIISEQNEGITTEIKLPLLTGGDVNV